MRDAVTLLHLSDIQFGRNHRFGNLQAGDPDAKFDKLFTRLTDDLSILSAESVRPDVLIVSGDLAETGTTSELDDAEKFLCELTDHLKLSGPGWRWFLGIMISTES